MSSTTPNIGLVLPVGSERVSRQIINENNTKIDTAIGALNSNITTINDRSKWIKHFANDSSSHTINISGTYFALLVLAFINGVGSSIFTVIHSGSATGVVTTIAGTNPGITSTLNNGLLTLSSSGATWRGNVLATQNIS